MANHEYRRHPSLNTRVAIYLFSLLFALAAPISAAQSNSAESLELAGRIVSVSGNVIARGANGDRPLSRSEAIYVGDTIFTDTQASTQIRMIDSALIALKELTEFKIVAYQFEQDISSDESTIELIQGGFRTITGSIGQQNRAAYEARISNYFTIGIRGTDYEVAITDNGVFTGVYDGGTTVSNSSGSLDLGIQANFDFAQVATPNSPPVGLEQQPPGLGIAPFAATIDADEEEPTEEENQNTEAETSEDADANTDESTEDQGGDNDVQAIASIRTNQDGNTEEETSSSSLNLQTPTAELAAQATRTGTSDIRGSLVDDASSLTVNPSETNADGSLPCAAGSSLCLQLVDGQITGDTETDRGGDTTTATITAISDSNTTTGNNGNGNAGNNGNGNGNSAGDDDSSSDTSDSTDDNTNGNSGNNDNGNDNGNSAGIDDSSSDTTDSTDDDSAGDDDGSSDATDSSDDDNTNGNSGNNGNGNSGNNGNGNGNSGNNGNGNSGNNGNGNSGNNGNGNSGNNGNGNSGNNGNGNGNSGNNGNGQTLKKPELTLDAQGISWGRWNSAVDDNFVVISQIDDDLVLVTTSDYLAQVNPAPIGKLTGSHNYATTIASSFIGSGSAGDISSLIAGMSVDFDTGVIDQGTLDILVADQAWSIGFAGSVNNGTVSLNASSGQLLDSTGIISNSIDANLGGVFSGDTGSAFVGGFDLIDEINTLNSVNGLFTIER